MLTNDLLTVKTANEWLRESKELPAPRMLFGDFWLEGELAILFADTGKGKSILAVQLAEAIARGRPVEPLQNTAEPQKVLYLDFELTAKQFEMRYSADRDPSSTDAYLHRHYKFSPNFTRVEIDLDNAAVPDGFRTFDEYLHASVESVVRDTGAKVLIVDNITFLKPSNLTAHEAVPLMRELKRLKNQLGLSILVLAHTPKRYARSRPISINDLQGSKTLANLADNIFAVGESRRLSAERYIKHIKPRSTELLYSSAHVPIFDITKVDGNFLSFKFYAYDTEEALLDERLSATEWETIEQIGRLSASGLTVRQIADQLELPRSTVHRKLQMHTHRGK